MNRLKQYKIYFIVWTRVYRIREGGLNSKMAANRDVIEYPLAMLWRHRPSIHKKINGIQTTIVITYNFEAKLMRLSDDIHNFITEIVDV